MSAVRARRNWLLEAEFLLIFQRRRNIQFIFLSVLTCTRIFVFATERREGNIFEVGKNLSDTVSDLFAARKKNEFSFAHVMNMHAHSRNCLHNSV